MDTDTSNRFCYTSALRKSKRNINTYSVGDKQMFSLNLISHYSIITV